MTVRNAPQVLHVKNLDMCRAILMTLGDLYSLRVGFSVHVDDGQRHPSPHQVKFKMCVLRPCVGLQQNS